MPDDEDDEIYRHSFTRGFPDPWKCDNCGKEREHVFHQAVLEGEVGQISDLAYTPLVSFQSPRKMSRKFPRWHDDRL